MRRPRLRFTVRRMTALVAVAALATWGLMLGLQATPAAARHRARAARHAALWRYHFNQAMLREAEAGHHAEAARSLLVEALAGGWPPRFDAVQALDHLDERRSRRLLAAIALHALRQPPANRAARSGLALGEWLAAARCRLDARVSLRGAGHHRDLTRKYEHAAGRPWLPVAPDPPEPK